MIETERTPDQIQKTLLLRAPLARVWRAVSDSEQFGTWFGVAFDGPFVAGQAMTGKMTPTKVDTEIAKVQEPYVGMPFDWTVERIEPPTHISFRWHPYAIEEGRDYSGEPTTLVVFELAEVDVGTRLTITESGFSKIPLERRAVAFAANQGGWELQSQLIEKYLASHAA